MKSTTIPWFETLTDSVSALGAAAREARTAHRAAQAAGAQYNLDRLQYADGAVTAPGQSSTVPDRPHDRTVFEIRASHLAHEFRMAALYDDAAAAYAYGAAWAIQRVLDGRQPPLVALGRQADGRIAIPDGLFPVPPAFRGLDGWDGHARFERARAELDRVGDLWAYVRGLDEPDDIPDAFDLLDVNEKLAAAPDAAFAFGQIAETALRHALLLKR
ncbi:hypothetical protein Snoj_44230 [Streptomyces nojiriensis]|uniref:Uncharacterized protein n=1 Tax=Streptomyces nojiriensis TaxID=66374 RepID=A0ABQ3SQT0_9ACTN|nr:hypothetical protein [Streptomyces nojiriensis]QTI44030.1 hypothetical protein JYK04_01793 [Streptomyces nojiriensis]QTI44055.1 hypothetical protein JYK04_01818 [Streptomyces nojiriensis]QTI44065.1 hypothetical protein JYK04_01828 [Streptomyces nojiriensis]GGR85797.1 hypothetical protein GCM10010205_12890 [Streptomyces nojiriensis]GHI70505.1 hypothetical protein Snoj_44230 [Streptomyces nojiriensis]